MTKVKTCSKYADSSPLCLRVDVYFIFECSTRYLTGWLRSLVRYRVEHSKIKFISTRRHVIFCLLYKHQWKRRDFLCYHNDSDLFTCEDNMLFSRVKIWSFHAKAPLVFHWCLYNKYIYFKFYRCLVSSVGRALVCCADVNTQGRKITEENVPPLWLYLQHI